MIMMGSKPNHQNVTQEYKIASPNVLNHKKLTFLPMLCSSSSTKQIKVSHRRCSSSTSTSSATSDEPSSPKVGCMGQVKRNNKVLGFPSFSSSTTSNNSNSTHSHIIKCHESNYYTSNSIVKYYKFKRFFSAKSPTSVIPRVKNTSYKGEIGRKKDVGNVCNKNKCEEKGSLVNIVDMDPPLPVVKKVVVNGNDGALWKRRLGGGAPLKIQVIQQNICLLPANNTV